MASEEERANQLVYPTHVQQNTSSLSTIKFLSSAFVGAVSGILGLENFYGFGLFIFSTFLTSAVIFVMSCKGQPKKYIHGNWWSMVNPGQDNVFSFVLSWTLFYGIVHVYD